MELGRSPSRIPDIQGPFESLAPSEAKIARELVLRTTVEAFPEILLVPYAWRQVGIPRGLSRSLVSVG